MKNECVQIQKENNISNVIWHYLKKRKKIADEEFRDSIKIVHGHLNYS